MATVSLPFVSFTFFRPRPRPLPFSLLGLQQRHRLPNDGRHPQHGSLEAKAGVFHSTFDVTGTRLTTTCTNKTNKVRTLSLLCCCGSVGRYSFGVNGLFCDRSMRSRQSKWRFNALGEGR
jgi:hypothetical protein